MFIPLKKYIPEETRQDVINRRVNEELKRIVAEAKQHPEKELVYASFEAKEGQYLEDTIELDAAYEVADWLYGYDSHCNSDIKTKWDTFQVCVDDRLVTRKKRTEVIFTVQYVRLWFIRMWDKNENE